MGEQRAEILGRVRRALLDSTPADLDEPPRHYRIAGNLDRDMLVELLSDRLQEYGVGVHTHPTTPLGTRIGDVLRDHGATRVAVADRFPERWRPAGFELADEGSLSASELAALDGALTTSALAIAETGTVVLDAGPGQGRRMLSLVCDLHVCVVAGEAIVETVPEAVARLAGVAALGSPLTLISGPSATSDIELNRVQGVHGPRRVEVVLAIKPEPPPLELKEPA